MSGIVDPSTPEREAVLAAWNELFTVCAQLTFNIADVDDVRVCAEKVESAIYARALADVAGWVEGMTFKERTDHSTVIGPCGACVDNERVRRWNAPLDSLLAKLREAK